MRKAEKQSEKSIQEIPELIRDFGALIHLHKGIQVAADIALE